MTDPVQKAGIRDPILSLDVIASPFKGRGNLGQKTATPRPHPAACSFPDGEMAAPPDGSAP